MLHGLVLSGAEHQRHGFARPTKLLDRGGGGAPGARRPDQPQRVRDERPGSAQLACAAHLGAFLRLDLRDQGGEGAGAFDYPVERRGGDAQAPVIEILLHGATPRQQAVEARAGGVQRGAAPEARALGWPGNAACLPAGGRPAERSEGAHGVGDDGRQDRSHPRGLLEQRRGSLVRLVP